MPKDTAALTKFSESLGLEPDLIRVIGAINNVHYQKASRLAKDALGSLKGKKIAILGLAFKPCTDNISNAPSIAIIENLLGNGAHVIVYDPKSDASARSVLEDKVQYARDVVGCIEHADCCIVATEWDEFKAIRPETFLKRMKQPIVIDGRGIYDVDAFSKAGVRLLGIGINNN